MCIAKWGVRNSIRILFPDLYSDTRKNAFLEKEEIATFYEKGLLPTLRTLLQDRGNGLPATYQLELFRSQGIDGKLSFGTKMLAAWLVPNFGDTLRRELVANGVPWGQGLVFLHQIKGVKDATYHSLEEDSVCLALADVLEKNSLPYLDIMESPGVDNWFIDVGLEISSERGECLAWRTDRHNVLLRHLAEVTEEAANRLTTIGSSQYYRDLTSHMTAVSGCRITPGPRARSKFDAVYFQLYTTDKALIYRPDHGHYGKYITVKQVLEGKAGAYLQNLYELYATASRSQYSCARVEMRIPFKHAESVLLEIEERTVYECLVAIPRFVWW
jgi:hypothetical protein